ncbi:hypothetical protein R83H12_02680 [Fibrobacteria bacterium R8-3-H12]
MASITLYTSKPALESAGISSFSPTFLISDIVVGILCGGSCILFEGKKLNNFFVMAIASLSSSATK